MRREFHSVTEPSPGKDRRRAQGIVEYAFILVIVVLVVMFAVASLGGDISNSYEDTANEVSNVFD
jgi:Flp pilus assembly pilin Flp